VAFLSPKADERMCVTFVIHRVPRDPRGEWVTGIEAAPGRFYRSRHFPTESAAAVDAVAMNAALRRNPWIAAEFCRCVRCSRG
jgi:hypothetical protein